MRPFHRRCLAALTPLAAFMVPLANASAQRLEAPRFAALTLAAGASQYDLSGTGTTPLVAARAAIGLNRWLLAEGSVSAMRPHEQFNQRATYLMPELQLQVQAPFAYVRPYLGLGAGLSHRSFGNKVTDDARTETIAGGMRMLVPNSKLAVQADLRIRGFGNRGGAVTADWTLGVGRTF